MGTGLCFPRRPIPQLEGRIALALRRFAPGLYLACTTHVPCMYLACTSQSPPNYLACTWLVPGFGPLWPGLHPSYFFLHPSLRDGFSFPDFCFLLSTFCFPPLPDCGFAWVHARLIVRDWMLDVGCSMFDVSAFSSVFQLSGFVQGGDVQRALDGLGQAGSALEGGGQRPGTGVARRAGQGGPRRGGRRAVTGGGTAGEQAERSGFGQVVQGSSAEGGPGQVVPAAYGGAAAVGERAFGSGPLYPVDASPFPGSLDTARV